MRISDPDYNRLRVLKAIRRAEPVARVELAQLTGLAGGTITEVVGELVGRGVLLEEKLVARGAGRPRVGLRLNPDAASVVAATLRPDSSVMVEIANARGDRQFCNSASFERAETLEQLVEVIGDAIESTIAQGPIPKSHIHSVGLALPGVIDVRTGELHWLATYSVRPVPVAATLQARLGLPVAVDSSCNLIARAEHWSGAGRQLDDFTLVMAGSWMALAAYQDGLLWSGGQNLNPELPHVKLGLSEGRPCICGGYDCLAAHASLVAVAGEIRAQRGVVAPDALLSPGEAQAFARDALAGDLAARAVFERAGRLLGVALGNYVSIANPARLLMMTEAPEIQQVLEGPVREGLRATVFPLLLDRTPVEWKLLSDSAYAEGAAALVLEQLYRRPERVKAATPAAEA